MSNTSQLAIQVSQLRVESRIKREKTSKTIEELKNFIQQHQDQDHLVIGFKKKDQNPYKSKDLKCELI
jgi:hypothetical protein